MFSEKVVQYFVLGLITASSDVLESEGRQVKQCWILCIKKSKYFVEIIRFAVFWLTKKIANLPFADLYTFSGFAIGEWAENLWICALWTFKKGLLVISGQRMYRLFRVFFPSERNRQQFIHIRSASIETEAVEYVPARIPFQSQFSWRSPHPMVF